MRRDPELRDYKLVFLTDRTQLDTQLTSTFKHAQDETIHHADSVKSLKELLESDSRNYYCYGAKVSRENWSIKLSCLE